MRSIIFLTIMALTCSFSINAIPSEDLYLEAQRLFNQKKYLTVLEKVESYDGSEDLSLKPLFLKGLSLIKIGRLDEAEVIFKQLTIEFPSKPEPFNNLAYIYFQKGELEKTQKTLEDALATNNSYRMIFDNLGTLFSRLASDAYKKAMQNEISRETSLPQLSLLLKISDTEEKTTIATSQGVPNTVNTKEKKHVAKNKDENNSLIISDIFPQLVNSWASAWKTKNVDKYISYYSKTFKGSSKSRNEWEAVRRSRITGPKSIDIVIQNLTIISQTDTEVIVRFQQRYKSNLIDSRGIKTLFYRKKDDEWLIHKELFSK